MNEEQLFTIAVEIIGISLISLAFYYGLRKAGYDPLLRIKAWWNK
jgi:hypothetical protein